MALVTGVDVAEIARLERALGARWGDRFAARVFTEGERTWCEGRGRRRRAESYAARFAAKEAVMKALGTGPGRRAGWREIEVVRAPGEAPSLRLHGRALATAERAGIAGFALSLSHGAGIAIAVVVAEARALPPGRPRAEPVD